MKKLILPIILLLTAVLFLAPKADAQTREECDKTRARASYNCLTGWTKCYYPCVDKTKDVSACYKTCKQSEDACNKQVDANHKACLGAIPKEDAKVSSEENAQPRQQPPASEAKKETPKQDGIRAMVGTHEIYDAARGAYINLNDFYGTVSGWIVDATTGEKIYKGGGDSENLLKRRPLISKEHEQKSWEEFLPIFTPGKENITAIQGQGEIKTSASPQFILIGPKSGDTLQVTYLDSTVRSTSDNTQLRYTWSADSGAVINVPKWSEIKFREPVEVEGFTSRTVELGQGEIEVKVRNNKPAENQFGVDAGWLGVTVSRTHFWVSQSQDKKSAVIGVYEGEVEVKTKDGKTIRIKPDGDKPGVVVVSRKLSPVKLVLVGLVIITVLGGIVLILRKRLLSNLLKKKR